MQSYARSVLPKKLNTCLNRNKVYFSHFVHNLYIKKLQNNFHKVGNFNMYTMFTWVSQKIWHDPWLKVIWSRSRSLTQYVHIFCQVLIFSIENPFTYTSQKDCYDHIMKGRHSTFPLHWNIHTQFMFTITYLVLRNDWIKPHKSAISFWNVAIICCCFFLQYRRFYIPNVSTKKVLFKKNNGVIFI